MKKFRVGILGATGMVGQRFISILSQHPWFEISCLAASPQSAGKTYFKALGDRWRIDRPIPDTVKQMMVYSVYNIKKIRNKVDLIFSALDLDKKQIKKLEINYAEVGIPVVSNNSAHRFTEDVPMVMPEINFNHLKLIDIQRKIRGWKKGLIAVKPNCSIQSYVSILTPLMKYKPTRVVVTSMQAISGAGKNFKMWPEMVDNVIPYIGDEEEKSEQEPMKIWGKVEKRKIVLAKKPLISANCIRVPLTNGHMAAVTVKFAKKPTKSQIIKAVTNFNPLKKLNLPSSPKQFIKYFNEPDRPQTESEREFENGMGITMGRLREDKIFDWRFIGLSHNTVRGAAGGAILLAELLIKKGYIAI